ncbi:DNA primase [Oxobacter pfennigii]|uniref:DNA primase n=1 Tax=Oxobacter pfennigii TaxID=36849 RepID=A0A0P8W5W6_9CLOT|nr:DNA primase [Oxobacter pfennigii]KPU44089.1 DNA primase [Oxobacter pfennigii]
MLIPENIIENIRESNDIVDVISEYVPLRKRGKNYVGLCPFHSEKTPSFTVQQGKQIYKCFGCGEGGNVVSFIMKHRNMDFIDAIKHLAERANIPLPDENGRVDNEAISLKEKLYEINKAAARFFYVNLSKSKDGLEYFKNRGITADIIKRFGLGYSINSFNGLMNHLNSLGFNNELLERAGLILKSEKSSYYDRFRNRVMFPVLDVKGKVIGFGGRVLDDSKPKYLNSPETLIFNKGFNLYGLNIASKNIKDRKILIVEGYMDVIALHQYGILNAVASLGTALTQNQAKLLKRHADDIYICYDSDTAGQAATLRGLDILTDAGCNVFILSIPMGKDPDEYIRAQGKEAFEKVIEDALPLTEYKIMKNSDKFDLSLTEGKIAFAKACAQELILINDPVIVDAYIGKISSKTGIAVSALYNEVSNLKSSKTREDEDLHGHINGKTRYNNNIDGQKLYLETADQKAEKFILYILCEKKEYFELIRNRLSCDNFNDSTYREAASIIYDKLNKNEDIIPAHIIDSFQTVEEMKKVSDIFQSKIIIDAENIKTVIDDYISLIIKHKLLYKKERLLAEMKKSEEKGDVQLSTQLLKEIVGIEKQLRMQ